MKEFENIDNLLNTAGRDLPYHVPVDYFENLPSRIQERCLEQYGTAKKSKVSPFWQVIRTQLSLAGGFMAMAIIAFAGYYYLRPAPQAEETTGNNYIQIVQKDIYEFDQGKDAKNQKDSEKDNLKDEMFKYLNNDNTDYVTIMEKY